MKKRIMALFLCTIMASGCGNGAAEREMERKTLKVEAGTGTEEKKTENTEENIEEYTEESIGTEGAYDPEKMHAELGEEIETDGVVTKSVYEKAAYLADMVYQENGAGNTIISPLSLDMALGLASGGAAGTTGEQLRTYLGKEDYGAFASEYMEYVEQMNHDSSKEKYGGYKTVFEIANSLWVSEDKELIADYAEKTGEQFRAEIEPVSFFPENLNETVERINGWCNEKTHGMIPAIISEDSVSRETAALLINSLYFEAPWVESWNLITHDFTNFDGVKSSQEMLTDELSCYFENEYATGFSKSYRNGLEFIGILPRQEGEFQIGDLDLETFLESRTTQYDVSALMPRLNFDTQASNIVSILKSQGVDAPFDKQSADFTKFMKTDNDEALYISDIIQKCKIELDEDGTRAVAVTAVLMNKMCAVIENKELKEVYLDRPFAFMIYDSQNQQILFLGKVVDL